jgi:hypothetical protein
VDNEQPWDVATDANGDVLLSMYASVSVDLGGGPLAADGKADVIVAKFTGATGAHVWSRRYGGTGNDSAYALTTDAQNNVFLAGSFDSTSLTFGSTTLSGSGSLPLGFMVKLNSAGTVQWARTEGVSGGQSSLSDVAISAGYPVVVGYFRGMQSYDGRLFTSAGDADAMIVRTAP